MRIFSSCRPGLHSPWPLLLHRPMMGAAHQPLPPSSALNMLDVCKCAAAQLDIPWPAAVAKTTRSRYEGKRLPLARSAAKQPLPVFPELLEPNPRSLVFKTPGIQGYGEP